MYIYRLQIFLSQGIGMGLGFGLVLVPSISVQARYYKKRRALATGIILSGNTLGGVIFPIS
jgi:MFS family permease